MRSSLSLGQSVVDRVEIYVLFVVGDTGNVNKPLNIARSPIIGLTHRVRWKEGIVVFGSVTVCVRTVIYHSCQCTECRR